MSSAVQEADSVLAEENKLLRQVRALDVNIASTESQVRVWKAERASMRERLQLLRGKVEGIELGQRLAHELAPPAPPPPPPAGETTTTTPPADAAGAQ